MHLNKKVALVIPSKAGDRTIFALLFFITAYFLNITSSFSAAWTQNNGSGQSIFTFNYYQSSHSFDTNLDRINSFAKFTKYEINPFVEYGLTNDITIGANPTLQYWKSHGLADNTKSINFNSCGTANIKNGHNASGEILDSEFFIRKKLLERGNVVLSLQPLIKTPCILFSDLGTSANWNSFEAEMRGLLGYGFKWDKELQDGKSRPFSGQNHFLNLEATYRKRNTLTDLVKIDGTAGFRFNESILLLGQFFSEIGTRKRNINEIDMSKQSPGTTVLYINRFANIKFQFSGVVQTSKTTSLQLGIYTGAYTEIAENHFKGYQGIMLSLWKGF